MTKKEFIVNASYIGKCIYPEVVLGYIGRQGKFGMEYVCL